MRTAGYEEFYEHFLGARDVLPNHNFILPFERVLTSIDDEVIVRYQICENEVELPEPIHFLAIFTFKNDKIWLWDEVISAVNATEI